MEVGPTEAWFREGLRFTCTRCGDCCTGAPGFVWVNEAEIRALAHRCGESPERFVEIYVRDVSGRQSLKELEDGSCVFFRKGHGCTVYEDRPRQCRTWPFWDSNLESPAAWRDTCRICPGSGTGELHTVETILAQSKVIPI